MTETLERLDQLLPAAPDGVEWSTTHIRVLDPSLPFETFEHLFLVSGVLGDVGRWFVGDLLNFGDSRYGERYAQALALARVGERSLRRYAYVCRQIPSASGRRRPNLSFSHHEAVARLTPEQQTRLLEEAEREGLAADELLDRTRDLVALDRPAPPRQEVLPAAGQTVDAARNLSTARDTLTTLGRGLEVETAEAVGIPRALRAVDDLGDVVRLADARASLTEAARRVVKNATASGGFYMVEAEVFQAFAALVAAGE